MYKAYVIYCDPDVFFEADDVNSFELLNNGKVLELIHTGGAVTMVPLINTLSIRIEEIKDE